ncbi:MAG: hypothetical protein QN187_14210 [Armatimonadota bacterium]|nr:hypothetical protein [Armatimonadota bacterium]MDR7532234.1 hypothetical protein [Armatimonadota bacterium]
MNRLAALPGYTPAVPFMVTALLLLPVAGAGAVFAAAPLAAGNVRAWPVLATNHLVTLGWATLVAMGALHQLTPAMLGVPARPGRPALVQFGVTLVGLGLLTAGFVARWRGVLVAGGLVTWAGVVLFAWLLARLAPRRRRWPLPVAGVAASVGALVLTATWGALMVVNWRWPFWLHLLTVAGIGTHVVLGLVGWLVQLVVSVSYYLLPRFVGVRPLAQGRLPAVLGLLNAGIAVLVVAALWRWGAAARLGVALLAATGGVYAVDLWTWLQATRGAKPDLTIQHWWVILAQTVLLAIGGLAWALGWMPVASSRLAATAGVLLLLGWVTMAIMGQLYKVTPFLMWFYRYARGLSALEVPRLPAPYYPREGRLPFYCSAAGGVALAAGVLLRVPQAALAGAVLFCVGAGAFSLLMAVSWMRAALRMGS